MQLMYVTADPESVPPLETPLGTTYIGTYAVHPADATYTVEPAGVDCPYCWQPLERVVASPGMRIVRVMDVEHEVVLKGEVMQATHDACVCADCHAVFTLPIVGAS